ncbi:hypothetical protein [Ignavibacterium sp.]|uniref:hypothetical protein n=1 Tax=Ignavibacterium sp. TaxID=2651167 RepID=UPI00307E4A9C
MYQINGKTYKLKEKYSLKDWGKILKLISSINQADDITNQIIILISDDRLADLLNTILDNAIEGEIYEDDFEEVNKIIRDFFSRKNGLMKNIGSP